MLLRAQLIVLVLLVALNTWLGIDKNLYFALWWWDIPTHFLGGVWAGLAAAWLFQMRKRKISILECAVFALWVGIAWEVFEHTEELAGSPFMPYWVDTMKDLLVDTFGGICAGLAVMKLKLWRR